MVRLCFSLLLLYKQQYRIHMPRRLMDDLKGEVADEEFHECAFGYDIFSADLNGEDALLLNIRVYRVFGVAHDISRLVCCERVGKVPKPRFNVVSECLSAFVSHLDIAVCNSHGIYRIMVMQYHRLLRRLGVEDTHGDFLSSLGSFLTFSSLMAYRCVLVGRILHGMMPFCSIHAAFRLLTWSIL